jgi:hypothetical protein
VQPDGSLAWSPHNHFEWSEEFNGSGKWTFLSANITAADDVAVSKPSGAAKVSRLTDDATDGPHYILSFDQGTMPLRDGDSSTFWVLAKAETHDFIFIQHGFGGGKWTTAVFDLSNAAATAASETAVGASGGTIVSTAQTAVGDDWYLLRLTGHINGTGANMVIGTAEAATGNTFSATGGQPEYAGTGTSLLITGAHLHYGTQDSRGLYVRASGAAVYYPRLRVERRQVAAAGRACGHELDASVAGVRCRWRRQSVE